MKKIKMNVSNRMTFKQECEECLDHCRARNLRNGTSKHYVYTINQLYKYVNKDMLIEEITSKTFEKFIIVLRESQP